MAIKANTGTPGTMYQAPNGDLTAITLTDTNPLTPTTRTWEIEFWPDNLASAPTITNATSNPATFTPPQAGEWYSVLLTRTGPGSGTERLAICIPDATGSYALPAPGLPADTDPTKTIVNKNDAAKAVGWAGGVRAGMPGLSGATRKAIALASAGGAPASPSNPGTQSIQHFNRTDGQWLSIEETGNSLQAAHDALSSTGGTIFFPDGDHTYSAVSYTRPVRHVFGRGTYTFTGSVGITTNYNVSFIGQGENETKLVAASGGTAVLCANGWHAPNEGEAKFFATHLTFSGGAKHIDANPNGDMTGFGFYEGNFHCENVTFENSTGISVTLADSTYYGQFNNCQWVNCCTSAKIGGFCETLFFNCIFKQSLSNDGPSLWLLGSHHTEVIKAQFYGRPPTLSPDIRLEPVFNGSAGFMLLDRCKFAPERENCLSSLRYRIQVISPVSGHEFYSMAVVRIRFCEFLGPSPFVITSIGRLSNVAKATISTPNSATGHLVRVGDLVDVSNTSDASFHGRWIVTAVTTNTVSWVSTGSDLGQANRSGFIASASVTPVKFTSPPSDWAFEGNHFDNYAVAIDDNFTENASTRDRTGRCVWLADNYMTGALGAPCQEFLNGGHGFVHFIPGPTSPLDKLLSGDQSIEQPEIRNRCPQSETLSTWNAVGACSAVDGQTPPDALGNASLITRTGALSVVDASDIATEALVRTFDQTGLKSKIYVSFWLKAGTTRSLFYALQNGVGLDFQAQFNAPVSGWKRYEFPIVLNAGGTPTYQMVFAPGQVDPMPGTIFVSGVQVSDYPGNYYPTTTTELHDTTVGMRLRRTALIAALSASDVVVTDSSKRLASLAGGLLKAKLQAAGGTPTITDVASALGSTGTITLQAGSTDYGGTIILTAGGSGIGNHAVFALVFSATLPTTYPKLFFTRRSGTGSWNGGSNRSASSVETYSSGVDNQQVGIKVNNAVYDGTSGLTTDVNFTSGLTYLIDYEIGPLT